MSGQNHSHFSCQKSLSQISTQTRIKWKYQRAGRVRYSALGATRSEQWNKFLANDGVTADRIIIRCGGAGRIRLTNVQAQEIITRIGGGGSVEIEGTVANHEVNVSGGATLLAKNLTSLKTEIQVNGGGNAVVNATEQLIASVNAGATLKYVETSANIEKRINKYADFSPVSAGAETPSHH